MIIKLNDNEVKNFKNTLIDKIRNEGFDILESGEGRWKIKGENSTEKIILEGKQFFKYFNEEHSNTSIKPSITIVDELNKEIVILLARTQEGSGSTDQKLPYGDFMLKDYVRLYSSIDKYDVKISFVLGSFFNEERYSELRKYLKSISIGAWVNEVKI